MQECSLLPDGIVQNGRFHLIDKQFVDSECLLPPCRALLRRVLMLMFLRQAHIIHPVRQIIEVSYPCSKLALLFVAHSMASTLLEMKPFVSLHSF